MSEEKKLKRRDSGHPPHTHIVDPVSLRIIPMIGHHKDLKKDFLSSCHCMITKLNFLSCLCKIGNKELNAVEICVSSFI